VFVDCWDRIERAKAHSKVIGETWSAFVADDPYDIGVSVDSDGAGRIWVEPRYGPMPKVLSLELGELLYQLRAALDGSIRACAILETGQDPPPNEDRLEFPITFGPDYFKASAWNIAPLTDKRRYIVESVQPYNIVKGLRPDYLNLSVNRSLALLQEWARIDRHRRLHVMGSWASSANPHLLLPHGTSLRYLLVKHDGLLEHESEIAEFEIEGWEWDMTMQANPDVVIDIALREPPPPAADNDTLGERIRWMIINVGVIVKGLEDSFLEERV